MAQRKFRPTQHPAFGVHRQPAFWREELLGGPPSQRRLVEQQRRKGLGGSEQLARLSSAARRPRC